MPPKSFKGTATGARASGDGGNRSNSNTATTRGVGGDEGIKKKKKSVPPSKRIRDIKRKLKNPPVSASL
jgi:hypothetical protein